MSRRIWIAGLAVSLSAGLILGFILGVNLGEEVDQTVAVPRLVGMNEQSAKTTLLDLGLVPIVRREEAGDIEEPDVVVEQDRTEGEELPEGTVVVITVKVRPRVSSSKGGSQTLFRSEVETRPLAAGTASQTPLYIIRGKNEGPKMLVLGGVHGNEPAAYYSGNMAARLRLDAGTLFVIPNLNLIAFKKGTREGIQDINRRFPGNPNGDPEEKLCWEVCELLKSEQIDYVLTFHEATGYMQTSSVPGQTLYYDWDVNPYAQTNLTQEANRIIAAVNPRIQALAGFSTKELFTTYVDPIPGSATFEFMEECGVDYALGCEVARDNISSRKVWFHMTFLTTWMEQRGLRVNNWSEVEGQIWADDYVELR